VNQIVSSSLMQLLSQLPTLLALLAGIVIFLVMMRRSVRACVLSAVSFALFLLGRIAHVFLANAILVGRVEKGWTTASMAGMLAVSSILLGLLEAAAFGMLIAAVLLAGRGKHSPQV
jgi:hypothetical protein